MLFEENISLSLGNDDNTYHIVQWLGDQSIMKIISLVATLVLCPEYLILYNLAYDSEIVCGFPQRQLCFKNVKSRTETKSWLISHHTLILVMIAHRPLFYFKIFFFYSHLTGLYLYSLMQSNTTALQYTLLHKEYHQKELVQIVSEKSGSIQCRSWRLWFVLKLKILFWQVLLILCPPWYNKSKVKRTGWSV